MKKIDILDILILAIPASFIYGALSLYGVFIGLWLLETDINKTDLKAVSTTLLILSISISGVYVLINCWSYILKNHEKKKIIARRSKYLFSIFLAIILILIVCWFVFEPSIFNNVWWLLFYVWNILLVFRLGTKFFNLKSLEQ